jgi:hypothetical protein
MGLLPILQYWQQETKIFRPVTPTALNCFVDYFKTTLNYNLLLIHVVISNCKCISWSSCINEKFVLMNNLKYIKFINC